MSRITESNRLKHFLYAIPCALFLTILFVGGLAAGMEFKDKAHGGAWDWLDILATILGGIGGANAPSGYNLCLKVCSMNAFIINFAVD